MTRMTIGRYRNASPTASEATLKEDSRFTIRMSEIRLDATALSRSPPPCGEGLGKGVLSTRDFAWSLPLSLTLPHKGGGNAASTFRTRGASSRAFELAALQPVVQQQRRQQQRQQHHRAGRRHRPVLVGEELQPQGLADHHGIGTR